MKRRDNHSEDDQMDVIKRARKKVLALLERSDRSEQEIRTKLLQAGYTQEQTEDAISYAKSYGYIDDERYAKSYVRVHCETKSRRQMEQELRRKGIDSQEIEDLFEDAVPEKETVRKLIYRKCVDVDELSQQERQKLAASLYRKGFPMEIIRSCLG